MKEKILNRVFYPLFLVAIPFLLASCGGERGSVAAIPAKAAPSGNSQAAGQARAVFASGCFWCTEAIFERVEGVKEVVSGYAGGTSPNPTYKKVSAGETDYAEAVLVYYDSAKLSYETLLDVFFHSHDPTQLNRQGPDIGKQYRSAIFFNSPYQQRLAQAYIHTLTERKTFSKPIVTQLEPLTKFWRAEAYHQDYYRLHPDDPYIRAVSAPKVRKFEQDYARILKKAYQE